MNEVIDARDDPEFFENLGPSDSGRLSTRPDEEEKAAAEPSPARRLPHAKWGAEPVLRNQFLEHPEMVRTTDPTTLVLDLSDDGDLERLNKIRRLEREESGPKVLISEFDRQFHDGKWSVYLTYERVQYQQV